MTATIQRHRGDLLSVQRGILIHGCNARGIMGAGVARAVRQRYPKAYEAYRQVYLAQGLELGSIIPWTLKESAGRTRLIIVNAITQQDFGTQRRYVDYEALSQCFAHTAQLARAEGLTEVHFPLIGCGLAGGHWAEVAPRISAALSGLEAHLWVFE